MIINKIKKNHLCLGCGLCASVLGNETCQMELNDDGFYYPVVHKPVDDTFIKELCPGIRVHGNSNGKLWGNFLEILDSWACDEEIRFRSSSGGVVSALAVYLLEEHKVDAVLHVGVSPENYLCNEMKVSRSRDEIINNAQSRYAPALTLYKIKQLLDNGTETFAFIGKGCDIAGVKNFIEKYPQYKDRFKIFISIICAGMPSLLGTEKAWRLSGKDNEPYSLKYRGDGWPGHFVAKWKDGTEFQLSYHESWGRILCRFLNFRCKVCADGIGSLADISIGDLWKTKDGYPDFEEQEGHCIVFARTVLGRNVMQTAKSIGYVNSCKIDDDEEIKLIQPGQYDRRKYAGWRILPVQIMTFGILDFQGLGIFRQAIRANFLEGFKNMKGTIVRFIRINRE